jgi:chemotaxis protein MotB
MKKVLGNICIVLIALVIVSTLTGCTNWKQEYGNLDIAYQNCEGRLQDCTSKLSSAVDERGQLGQQLSKSMKTIADLEKQLKDGASQGEASGFGDEMDVKYDPAKGTITVTLQNTVLFAPGKAELKKTTVKELDHIRKVLKERYLNMQLDIVGHTDSDPIKKSKWKDNWQLSSERALSVLRYLNSKGITDEMIRAVAAGSSNPVASNKTAAGKAKNRRVEIVVHTR